MSKINTPIIVTGASSGIGRAITEALLAREYKVIGIARDFEKFQINKKNFESVSLDLAALQQLPGQLDKMVQRCSDVSGVICCAGMGRFGSLEEFSYEQIDEMIRINLTSQIYIARAFMPLLKKNNSGDFIFIGSEAALTGGKRGAVYSASKFGVRGLAQALRHECSTRSVRVSIINPGMVKTEFFDQLGFGPGEDEANYILPEDVARTVIAVLEARPEMVIDEINMSPLKKVIINKGK